MVTLLSFQYSCLVESRGATECTLWSAGDGHALPPRGVPEVPFVPCRGEPFRAENEARPPVDVVVAWSLEAVLKSGAGSCAVGRCVCFEHEDQICLSLQLLRVAAPR